MEITNATNNDFPQIVSLLKMSLGEKSTPKSESYFKWKHEMNFFGNSKILIAKEDDKIIGLRAFMKWKWRNGNEIIKAVRAVDTATDPAFQGKGIFKKLTLQAVEECKEEGYEMVFNTPNESSMRGYLKMGWTNEGRMPILAGVGSLFPLFYSEQRNENIYAEFSIERELKKISDNYIFPLNDEKVYTGLSGGYLNWRFRDCPVFNYGAIVENNFGIVFRMKKLNKFTELRICEIWQKDKSASGDLKTGLNKIIKASKPIMVSCAPSALINYKLGLFGPFFKGPVIAIRPLAISSLEQFKNLKLWQPSIGSIELF